MAMQQTSADFRPDAHTQRLQKAAQQALAYLNDPNGMSTADIAHAMDTLLGRWMDQRSMRARVPREVAEELTHKVWLKLLAGNHVAHTNPFALICRVHRSVLLDYLREVKRDPIQWNGAPNPSSPEFQDGDPFDELVNEAIDDMHLSDIDALELRDCLIKQFHLFDRQHPGKFHLFLYMAEGLSYEDIAHIEFPECTEKNASKFTGRVRGRIEEARKKAREFFEICRN